MRTLAEFIIALEHAAMRPAALPHYDAPADNAARAAAAAAAKTAGRQPYRELPLANGVEGRSAVAVRRGAAAQRLLRWPASPAENRAKRADEQRTSGSLPDLPRPAAQPTPWRGERNSMTGEADGDADKARRFREAALPCLDDMFTYARYLMRSAADAEDAVQECYLRAFQHFDSYRGPAIKPWLLTILRNVCNAEFARRGRYEAASDHADEERTAEPLPMWQEPPVSPEGTLIQAQDDAAVRRMVAALPEPFREVIVLREMNDLSYDQIAKVAGVPVGTVMSRLARARTMLRTAWNGAQRAMPGTLR